jgi:hypothetical protein
MKLFANEALLRNSRANKQPHRFIVAIPCITGVIVAGSAAGIGATAVATGSTGIAAGSIAGVVAGRAATTGCDAGPGAACTAFYLHAVFF